MTRDSILIAASCFALSACGGSGFESNIPLDSDTDITTQSIHSAICTRGNSGFKVLVAKDGSAVGRIVRSEAQIKARIAPVEFPATFRAVNKRTVVLEIPVGNVTDEPVSETLSQVIKGGEIVMRGNSFDCTDVRVRQFN